MSATNKKKKRKLTKQLRLGSSSGPTTTRVWCMPNSRTFDMKPLRELLGRYLSSGTISVDPFARDSRLATYTNDLNPETKADEHMEATLFMKKLYGEGVRADVVLLDPPYSPRQVVEVYQGFGHHKRHPTFMKSVRDEAARLVCKGGIVISCGWNTNGLGLKRGFRIVEILVMAHGASHSDTLVTVERMVE